MICEVRGVFPTSQTMRGVCGGGRGRPPAGPAAGLSTRTHSHTHTHSQAYTPPPCGSGGRQAPSPSRIATHPQPTPTYMYFCPEKSVNKASLAPNEAFLSDFFGSIKQTVASFD
ncbi:unnamed protein product [Rangifer tarandus platyrhynchus]|uniref:Uncharacterized protein n=2 Tax=Rangifer tarandus platyrhynchus TaxID=3082113 RepID=A0ABN8YIQ0_RANTA|nr:unnamed protein product [Rangifer tarandus platyrhynchus]